MGIFHVILAILISSQAFAESTLFKSYEPYYGEKRLDEYVVKYNGGKFTKTASLQKLKSYYKGAADIKYLDLEAKRFNGNINPSLIFKNNTLAININGKKVATVTGIDPVSMLAKVNGQDVGISASKSVMKVHQEFNTVLSLRTTTLNFIPAAYADENQKDLFKQSLFVVIPIVLDVMAMTFEMSVNQLAIDVCKNPNKDYFASHPFETHFLMTLKRILVPSARVIRTCDYWAQLEANKGSTVPAERLSLLCTTARKALGCATESSRTPFGIKKAKK